MRAGREKFAAACAINSRLGVVTIVLLAWLICAVCPVIGRGAQSDGSSEAVAAGGGPLPGERTFWQTYRWGVIAAASLCAAQAALIVGLLASHSRRRAIERSLRESEARLRAILDTAVEAIITIDESGRIESVNAAAQRVFEYPASEMIGQNVKMLMPEALQLKRDRYLAHLIRAAETRVIGVGREIMGRRKSGGVFPMELAVSRIQLDGRRLFTGFVRDVSERKEAERTARDLSGRLIKAQESERARLARDLHDDVTQRLARLAIDVSRIEREGLNASNAPTLQGVQAGLSRLSEDVHSLAYQLHPSVLEDLGLADAIRTECENFSRSQSIRAEVQVNDVPEGLPRDAAICIFRIAQEALRNVVRHAKAKAVRVSLAPMLHGVRLAVRDDGIGFDPARHRARPSLGHASMLERARLMGGELDIESSPGRGTTVVAWVPVKGED